MSDEEKDKTKPELGKKSGGDSKTKRKSDPNRKIKEPEIRIINEERQSSDKKEEY